MPKKDNDIALGRFLSLVLRHQPQAAGITLDEHGWADVDALLVGVCKSGRKIDREKLEQIVRDNNKQRYSFNADGTKIRANQGHSLSVDVELIRQMPPEILYHGTASRFLPSIQQQGITRQSRQYVHLSAELNTAWSVGRRHGKPIVLVLNAAAMAQDDIPFYLSANHIWLCPSVPWQYIREIITE